MVEDIQIVYDYAAKVRSGIIPSCETIRLGVERWYSDLERDDVYFDAAPVLKFIKYARCFRHYKGPKAGQRFELEPWQCFFVANLLGLKWTRNGRRKYRMAELYVPRKNGKTFFAAILTLWFLMMDDEAGPEVYTAAVDKEQARLCYDASVVTLRNSIFNDKAQIMNSRVVTLCPRNNGIVKPLSKDTKNKDGLNIHAAICDEPHAWPNTEMLDVIRTGMGARSQPVLLRISTAGVDPSYPYFGDIEMYIQELKGIKQVEDDHFFWLYSPDPGDEYDDEEVWKKLNPNLGISLDMDYMRSMCAEAKLRGGTHLAAFKTKNLNMWVNAPDNWIDDDIVCANNAEFDTSKLMGEEAYIGIDLARKTDICAAAAFFPKYRVVKWLFVIPEEKVRKLEDRVDYRLWSEQGWIKLCPGEVLDEEWYISTLLQWLDQFKVKCVAYDPWAMWNILDKFGRYKEYLMEYKQGIHEMSVPTKWLEAAIIKREMNFLRNPVARWMFGNVVVYIDPNENIKLDKKRSRNKIDGVVALVDAIGGWLNKTAGKTTQIYSTHTLRSVKI